MRVGLIGLKAGGASGTFLTSSFIGQVSTIFETCADMTLPMPRRRSVEIFLLIHLFSGFGYVTFHVVGYFWNISAVERIDLGQSGLIPLFLFAPF